MLKRYLEFITEKLKSSDFENNYYWFIDIFDSKLKNSPIADNIYSRNERTLRDYVSNDEAKKIVELKSVFSDYRKEFSQKIIKMSEFYSEHFTNLAHKIDADPDKDFTDIQNLIDRSGFTIEILKNLFDYRISSLISESFSYFISKYDLDIINGYVDVYLYYINKELNLDADVKLSGMSLREMTDDEYLIKYAYGYHKTPYGLLFLKQNNTSIEKFSEMAISSIKPYVQEQFDYLSIEISEKEGIDIKFEISEYLTLDDDRFIFHYADLATDFNNKSEDKKSYKYTPEFFRDYLISNCPDLRGFNFQDTENELIISSRVDV
jgi:hypothetical protein